MEVFDVGKYPGLGEILRSKPVDKLPLKETEKEAKSLSHQILQGKMRDYVVSKVKTPLMKAITILAKRFPDPTRENTLNPNTEILFDIRDKFLEYEDNPGRIELFKALFKLFIIEYEHDPYYRSRINFLIEEIVEATMDGKWLPRGDGRPIDCWKEPKPFGLYQGRRFKGLIHRISVIV